jgi:3-hydroxyisobutyrate dehydrogenase
MTQGSSVGFVGLGAMGGAIAAKMLSTIRLQVFDLDAARVAALVKDGAVAAESAAALARQCDIVLTCLPRSEGVERLVLGADGIGSVMKAGSILVDMTTGDPEISRRIAAALAERGIAFADAPVAGGPHGARDGKLAVFVGAPVEVFERVYPVLSAASRRVFHTGGVGTGDVMKLVNNVIASSIRAITFEAIAMAAKNGIDLKTCAEILPLSSARSYQTEVALPRLVEGRYAANFAVDLMIKDLRLATRLGKDSKAPMMIGNLVCELYQAMSNQLGPDADVDELMTIFERQAGVKVVPPAAQSAD